MMTKTAVALLLVVIGLCSVAVAQPPPPPPPPPPPVAMPMPVPPVEIGLLAAAESRIGALGLMTVGRALSKDEQAQIADAHEVAELLGAGGRNFLGPISKLARERGVFQESIRALARGQHGHAVVGLCYCLTLFPDAKIVHRELAKACLRHEMFATLEQENDVAILHWAVATGHIPEEDELFVSLIKLSLVNWKSEAAEIPEQGPGPLIEDSIVTVSRARAALSLAGKDKFADEVQLETEERLEGDNKYPELAAATVVELSLAAAQALLEGGDFAGRSEAVEGLQLAGIAACDGKWVDCRRRLTGARMLRDREQASRLMEMAFAVAQSLWSPGHQLPPEVREAAEQMTDFPVLQALLAFPVE